MAAWHDGVGVGRVDLAARQRDLARVRLQVVGPPGEQQRRLRPARDDARPRVRGEAVDGRVVHARLDARADKGGPNGVAVAALREDDDEQVV